MQQHKFENVDGLVRKRLIYTGKRTEWSPIRSVNLRVITKSDDLLITNMITDRHRRHEVHLPINNKDYNSPEAQ